MPILKTNPARTLLLFSILYPVGIVWQLWKDQNYVQDILQTGGYELGACFSLLMLLVLAGPLLQRHFRFFWLLAAVLYFVIYRHFVLALTPDNHSLPASNHIMVFWVFVVLGFSNWLNASRSVFLLKFLLLFSYFAGGLAKARSGLVWMNGYSLQYNFLERHIFLDLPLAMALVANLSVARAISWLVVVSELALPLAFLNKKLEYFFAASFFIFQIICWKVLKLQFMQYYGWIYLIYVAEILNYFIERFNSKNA